ncbi:alanine--tRNA ligase [Acidiferrimicrobium sp. IK]|uniref:alanine--tRNA ligase n=1 Tax=Acidiferrimicrobium sp. IK TaxID=2871700 RepID=UPI0021CB55AF|nr:alanine--tRNA ligase [Acidiferrimicrobium sp. IK]MCU4185700.1 alanine--tRNA ligase [Acidiferrimicrobium sp. IK]
MAPTSSDAVRETFLQYFRARNHTEIQGASVLAKDDPTLLFINSGMAAIKDYFTGVRTPPTPNLTNIQPCIRTIDIDDIGDRHHLSFFEMMGSWSIGEYWKDRAVELAYELLTDGFGFNPAQLYVTVHEGDEAMGIPFDEESASAWERVGMPRDHIVAQPTADNFWGPAGNSGPCGPCTEVFLDTGEEYGEAYRPGGEFDTERRYIEIWNAAVCMQYDKGLDGKLSPLPFRSIDTGSGLERITLALNGYDNVYQTDLLSPLVTATQDVLGELGDIQRHHRVIADHLRASVAIMAEGVVPGNEGAGYIPRRLLRRAATLALTRGLSTVDFSPVAEAAIDRLGGVYPHYRTRQDQVISGIRSELGEFEGALRRGLGRLDELLSTKPALTGADAYDLLSTFGLPEEIAREVAASRGAAMEESRYRADFEAARHTHQERSRGEARTETRILPSSILPASVLTLPATTFVGYDRMTERATVLALLGPSVTDGHLAVGGEADLIVDRTPLYGEGGGQVGDRGSFTGPSGAGSVEDTIVHSSGKHIHRVRVTEGTLSVGETITLATDDARRAASAANHSATHLLNAALRRVLGAHVRQAGSLVTPDRLRFDFTHPKPVSPDEMEEIERLVNNWVLDDLPRTTQVMTPAEAIAAGATSLEGESYPDDVRVVSFGGDPAAGFATTVSTELCGGTHVTHSGQLGLLRIVSQESVASGVRRITAYTRHAALEHTLEQGRTLATVAGIAQSSPRDVVEAVERLATRAAAKAAERKSGPTQVDTDAVSALTVGGVDLALAAVPPDQVGGLRGAASGLAKTADRVAVLWTDAEPSTMAVAVPARYQGVVNANTLLRGVLAVLGGKGGGNDTLAQGGGARRPDPDALGATLAGMLPPAS